MYNFLFGPVPSRRLGMSLGVDLVPKKVCSLDCVYCEVGKTTKLTTERMEYVPFARVKEELENYFSHNPDPDYITFSGSGEPCLNKRIGEVIKFIKGVKPELPVAVLTNGTLLSNPDLRSELKQADLVMPSLDAASPEVFQRINRPVESLDFDNYIQGLIDFRSEYRGKIALEVFILPDYNDSPEELERLAKTIQRIGADSVQLNALDRPGTVPGLRSASKERLEEIAKIFGLKESSLIASAQKRTGLASYRTDTESAILETIARRPCTGEDLSKILGLHLSEINKYLDVLDDRNAIEAVRQERGVFYQLKAK